MSFLDSKKIPDEQLLSEVEDLIRNRPERTTIRHELDENFEWFGRVSAVIEAWDLGKSLLIQTHLATLRTLLEGRNAGAAFQGIMTLLFQARSAIQLRTSGPTNVAISSGSVFTYFDEVRKILELSTTDVLIVDPYLNVDFVSRYLSQIKNGVLIRLLTKKDLISLLPAVELFVIQTGKSIEVRSREDLHDRYIFIDRRECYHSGASLKDGAKKSPTSIIQILDPFQKMLQTYEEFWASAKVER